MEERIYTDREVQVFIKFVNNITFRMELGNPKPSTMSIRDEVLNLLKGNYTVGDSSIGKDGKKLTLYLTMKTPVKEVTLDENTIVGVDLGIAVPAVCALNNCDDRYLFIGSKKAHTDFCTKMQNQRSRLQEQLALNRGGHGRKKKCKPLDRFTKREHNYKTTSNHKISRDVVDFAIEHHAKYIHLEDLSGISKERKNKWVLRNWTYAQLQEFIEYKAAKVGIIVKYINPHHTSQNCSACREWCEGNREDQAHFKCKICGNEMNADLNAARNIAMSTNYSNKKSATDDVDEDEVA